MGPLCGALKCKCVGVMCPHDDMRLKLLRVRSVPSSVGHIGPVRHFDVVLAKCDECGCAWAGHPSKSTLQSSFMCQSLLDSVYDVAVSS